MVVARFCFFAQEHQSKAMDRVEAFDALQQIRAFDSQVTITQ
jgi:hypothetical protein